MGTDKVMGVRGGCPSGILVCWLRCYDKMVPTHPYGGDWFVGWVYRVLCMRAMPFLVKIVAGYSIGEWGVVMGVEYI